MSLPGSNNYEFWEDFQRNTDLCNEVVLKQSKIRSESRGPLSAKAKESVLIRPQSVMSKK